MVTFLSGILSCFGGGVIPGGRFQESVGRKPNLELAFIGGGYSWLRGAAGLVPGILAADQVDLFLLAGERSFAALRGRIFLRARQLFLGGAARVVNRARVAGDDG